MDKDFSADFNSEALPSIATLERYVGGDMAIDERERLEAQIAKDPLLADAVDGLRMSLGEADHTARLSRIRSRVASSVEAIPQTDSLGSKRKSRVKPFPQYLIYTAVAAGFALLLVFVGLMRNGEDELQNPDLITQNQTTEPEQAPAATTVPSDVEPPLPEAPTTPTEQQDPPSTTSPRAASAPQPETYEESGNGWGSSDEEEPSAGEAMFDEIAEEDDFGNGFASAQNASPPEPVSVNATSPGAPAVYETPTAPTSYTTTEERQRQEEDLAKMAREAIPEETEVIREPTRPANAPVINSERPRRQISDAPQVDFNTNDLQYQNEADQTAGAVSKAQVMADLLTEAIRLHDNSQLDSANLLLDEVLLSEKNNVVASYYKGKSLVEQAKFEEAIPFLLTASKIETSAVFEEAQWQLAKAYLGSGKKRKTTSLLRTISGESGKYQTAATELLQNMD